jgi:sRNA-binding protein
LLAALSQDGEVELAAAGETAAGALVLSVAEDGVRLRLPDGSERSLQPPE